tara:strand:+ start:873 stop:1067 length:195 start_codon:yes stop_codon:yes gene_type:complete
MEFENGIYKSENAIYFIYKDKIMMRINGSVYKTNKNFMQGKRVDDLKPEMITQFDEVYNKLKSW